MSIERCRSTFRAAETAYKAAEEGRSSEPEKLHDWLLAEIAFHSTAELPLFIQPRSKPTEPHHLQVWRDVAEVLRNGRLEAFARLGESVPTM